MNILQGFTVGSKSPIDSRFVLTKSQMAQIDDNVMPDVYFASCLDDGNFYIYKKTNEKTEDLGRFIAIDDNISDVIVVDDEGEHSTRFKQEDKYKSAIDLKKYSLKSDSINNLINTYNGEVLKTAIEKNSGEILESSVSIPIKSLVKNVTLQGNLLIVTFFDDSKKEVDLSNLLSTFSTKDFVIDAVQSERELREANFNTVTGLLDNHIELSNPHNISKSTLGLSDVQNYSAKNMPLSDAAIAALSSKVDTNTVYSKQETDELLNNKQNQLSFGEYLLENSGSVDVRLSKVASDLFSRNYSASSSNFGPVKIDDKTIKSKSGVISANVGFNDILGNPLDNLNLSLALDNKLGKDSLSQLEESIINLQSSIDEKQDKVSLKSIANESLIGEGNINISYVNTVNKPTINGKELVGDLLADDLDLATKSELGDQVTFRMSGNILYISTKR